MPYNFCSQCGTSVQPLFRFCPGCGNKIPSGVDVCEPDCSGLTLNHSPHKMSKTATATTYSMKHLEPVNVESGVTTSPITAGPSLHMARNTLHLAREVRFNMSDSTSPSIVPSTIAVREDVTQGGGDGAHRTPQKQHNVTFREEEDNVLESPTRRSVRGKKTLCSPSLKQPEEGLISPKRKRTKQEDSPEPAPVPSPITKSPSRATGKGKSKKTKDAVEPLLTDEVVTDTTGCKWKPVKLLAQTVTEIIYEVLQSGLQLGKKSHILKLGAKDGRIFKEFNFLQRAAKFSVVDKWVKQKKMDFLGIPSCVAFGFHADSYRFLIFPNMGPSLQSLMVDNNDVLPEKAVLQLACRLLDVLQYIHSHEYVHGDINAENIHVENTQRSHVYLAGYSYAFRYCPAGKHIEYREASRTAHEGTVEFTSLDAHKGAAPSRRSDLQSLGYCMLRWHTGTLPWTQLTEPEQVASQKQRYMDDVPALLSHCFGRAKVSGAFQSYLTTVMALPYTEEPDYSALTDELRKALQQMGGSVEEPLMF